MQLSYVLCAYKHKILKRRNKLIRRATWFSLTQTIWGPHGPSGQIPPSPNHLITQHTVFLNSHNHLSQPNYLKVTTSVNRLIRTYVRHHPFQIVKIKLHLCGVFTSKGTNTILEKKLGKVIGVVGRKPKTGLLFPVINGFSTYLNKNYHLIH